mgnify:CR=1 FL=1
MYSHLCYHVEVNTTGVSSIVEKYNVPTLENTEQPYNLYPESNMSLQAYSYPEQTRTLHFENDEKYNVPTLENTLSDSSSSELTFMVNTAPTSSRFLLWND